MDLEKLFHDLESNQNYESEEAKKKLVEYFAQIKDQWLVHSLMEYYLKTGSVRIVDVLIRAQGPHDGYIFDRLADWLKTPSQRINALNLFCFVVRRHPTWLFKVEKHRLIKDMLHWLKQLEIEKEIVPLMSALLAIITLLPIIPNLVPNFLNDLFAVFAHLASWNSQHPSRLSEDKLVHLQLGLQMLFHRLYGMFPCNFMAFLADFIRKEKGAIFQHTIKPLLETVRLHPMLVTATVETETNSERWKEIQPHDVVVECMRLSLPMKYHDISTSVASSLSSTSTAMATSYTSRITSTFQQLTTAATATSTSAMINYQTLKDKPLYTKLSASGGGVNSSGIWSPSYEFINSTHTPMTPTPYMMPSALNQGSLGVSGCSPPEAAVEATPETTPLKDNRELKRPSIGGVAGVANPLAVRAIFANSQPSSPHRGKDSSSQHYQLPQTQHFHFPDVSLGATAAAATTTTTTTFVEQELNARIISRMTTTCDRKIQQVLLDRNQSQSPFQPIEAQSAKMGFQTPTDYCRTPDVETGSTSGTSGRYYQSNSITPLSALTATPTSGSTPLPVATTTADIPITKVCDECNETDQTLCTEGGLQMPTSRSMHLLAKGIKRRNRMTSYCYNEKSCEKIGVNGNNGSADKTLHKVRRTKSLSSLNVVSSRASQQSSGDLSDTNDDDFAPASIAVLTNSSSVVRPLQKCPKMISIASVLKTNTQDKCVQTLEAVPLQNHENSLLQMLMENNQLRTANEASRHTPNEILDQFILRGLHSSTCSLDNIFDKEQFQLLNLQLQYERYRREIHAERNRRLMGRSRDKRSLEMERERLKEQLKDFEMKNKELSLQLDKTKKATNEREREYQDELSALKTKYQNELEQNRCLRQANENLQTKLTEDVSQRKDINYEVEALRGQVFSLTTELQHAQQQADVGMQCRQELARLEADFIVMGEVQIKCRDKLTEIDNYKARDEELHVLQEAYNIELKDLKHSLDDKTSQLDSARHKIQELHSQLLNNEKVITEQKRLLRAVKDEYEEKFKALNKKYEVQKTIIAQMEEKFMMSLHKPLTNAPAQTCSPDTDKTDIASSVERNSPLSTSLASSESLSTSLRSSELRNLQQLVEHPIPEVTSSSINVPSGTTGAGISIVDGQRLPPQTLDLASSANTATSLLTDPKELGSPEMLGSTTMTHMHPHSHLQPAQHQQPTTSKMLHQHQHMPVTRTTPTTSSTMEQTQHR
ncbi:hamartin [Stomoxys calcitrans]|uniref:Tuberous sclerosis 1 n=1 Tax=Stomoxys calcitrans TaxID=35570 RepID=A0A1I8NRC4_STOCA|nr:hamartin [Stomoxys calcitrans]XP_013111812.1 hamartin [Stomoxys calcitrans]